MTAGAAMVGLMAVCCGLHLVVLPLLATGVLAGLAGAFTGQVALALTGGVLVLGGAALLLRRRRWGGTSCAALGPSPYAGVSTRS